MKLFETDSKGRVRNLPHLQSVISGLVINSEKKIYKLNSEIDRYIDRYGQTDEQSDILIDR